MPGPLEGVRAVELGFWVAGPAAGGILADWGAEVIKIEPPDGDPFRGMFLTAAGVDVPINPPFELDNRGKRSIAVDLQSPDGQALARRLLGAADVFITNLRAPALERLGLDYPRIRTDHPGLIYCHVSGYGTEGDDRDRAAYDIGAYWARAGIALSLVPPGEPPPQQRGGMGDHTTALSAVGAICAALISRQRTGEGQFIATSLMRTGLYILGWDASIRIRFGKIDPPYGHANAPNPLVNSYQAGDGTWFWLLGLQGDRHWPDLVAAVERPELLEDPRFRDIRARKKNCEECIRTLDEIFAQQPFAHWRAAFDRCGMWWAPVQTVGEAVIDPQARAAGAFVQVPSDEGAVEMLASPADFAGTPWVASAMPPELGQHTEEILLELGLDWEQIGDLKGRGVIP